MSRYYFPPVFLTHNVQNKFICLWLPCHWKESKVSACFLSMSYERPPSPPPPPHRLWNFQRSCWNENEIKWNETWWSHSLVRDLLIMPQQKLYAWLIMNHRPNALWCKIHNPNIMLRTIFKHSEALLQLPVSMYFAFIYQLKMHLVWIWKYYAKLQCSRKQIMVLWDGVVLND